MYSPLLGYTLIRSQSHIFSLNMRQYNEDRDSSVGIATRMDGPGIEPQLRQDFPNHSRPALGQTILLYIGYRVFAAGKAAGVCR
jgi:hypothetical protein